MEGKDKAQDQEEQDFVDESFIEKPAILDKYKAAAQVTNLSLEKIISLCVPGADIHTICSAGDKFIEEEL